MYIIKNIFCWLESIQENIISSSMLKKYQGMPIRRTANDHLFLHVYIYDETKFYRISFHATSQFPNELGEKYEAAKKAKLKFNFNIKLVNHRWLEDWYYTASFLYQLQLK